MAPRTPLIAQCTSILSDKIKGNEFQDQHYRKKNLTARLINSLSSLKLLALNLFYFHSPGSAGSVELYGMQISQNVLDTLNTNTQPMMKQIGLVQSVISTITIPISQVKHWAHTHKKQLQLMFLLAIKILHH